MFTFKARIITSLLPCIFVQNSTIKFPMNTKTKSFNHDVGFQTTSRYCTKSLTLKYVAYIFVVNEPKFAYKNLHNSKENVQKNQCNYNDIPNNAITVITFQIVKNNVLERKVQDKPTNCYYCKLAIFNTFCCKLNYT